MEIEQNFEELLIFFKTLSDQNRLKIIGFLAEQPLSVEQLAEKLNLSSSTVSHHLSKLSKAKLVSARAEGYYSIYQLESQNLEKMAQRMLATEKVAEPSMDLSLDPYDQKVLKTYLDSSNRIISFPTKEKKLKAILRFVLQSFESGKHYHEKDVNTILSAFSDDTAFLRRSLIEYGMMNRQAGGNDYWRSED